MGSLSFMVVLIVYVVFVIFWYLLVLFGPVFCLGQSGSYHVAVCVAATSVGLFLWWRNIPAGFLCFFPLVRLLFSPRGIRVGFHCVVVFC